VENPFFPDLEPWWTLPSDDQLTLSLKPKLNLNPKSGFSADINFVLKPISVLKVQFLNSENKTELQRQFMFQIKLVHNFLSNYCYHGNTTYTDGPTRASDKMNKDDSTRLGLQKSAISDVIGLIRTHFQFQYSTIIVIPNVKFSFNATTLLVAW